MTKPVLDPLSPLHQHFRRFRRIWLGTCIAWLVVSLGASRLAGMRTGDFGTYDIIGGLLCGIAIGTAMAWFETRPVRVGYINNHPWLDIALRTVLYTAVVAVVILVGRLLLFRFFPSEATGEVWRSVPEMLNDRVIRRFIVLLLMASFALNFFLHLRLMMGPSNLQALFTGRYRLPVEEERLFVFIDLVDSTAIAERLGPLEFTHFKHDFFCDLAEPLLATGGHIVQYVGDEVMITWRKSALSAAHSPLRFLQLTLKQLERRRLHYERRFATVPRFRTGIHAGMVVVAEVGDTRRDIVYSGDTVNTAARLLQACRPQGVQLLLSERAREWIAASGAELPHFASQRAMELRGRSEPLAVLAPASTYAFSN